MYIDSCIEQGVGLGGLVGPFQLSCSMAASSDDCVLPPVFEAVSLCAPVAGERGWEGAVAPCPASWSLADDWLATV